ncbi:LysR family transcriptional regulator [Mycobacterium antarcticum]|uniref:SDR family oxidoreductase n=1 Tax=Mycolicibacterium sp. TUM20985 TaxID=3023370 RepID=UPI002572786D|nr:NAD(P)H-binding protein [Mycolicibacterium sp. TUM20985]BDX31572.1 LysR family transcriptional regulator [Mycolicibacterium sp. TUM20985]
MATTHCRLTEYWGQRGHRRRLAQALTDAHVVDVSNSPSLDDEAVLDFFTTSTGNLLSSETAAGVRHHVALSIVGADKLPDSGYMRDKIAQEQLIKESDVPYSIVRAAQFYEFIDAIADSATSDTTVRLPHALIRAVAADDVAREVTRVALGEPADGTIEIVGPEPIGLDDPARTTLAHRSDPRDVLTDPEARYFGALLSERTLLPGVGAYVSETLFAEWISSTKC